VAAIAAETAVVAVVVVAADDDMGDYDVATTTWVLMADNGGIGSWVKQPGGQQWLGRRRTMVWLTEEGNDVGNNVGQSAGMRQWEGARQVAVSPSTALPPRLLFSHFTRDFVGDFDILLMHKVGLKGDGEGWQQQREGSGGGNGRGEGLWRQE
jgi:hypothetical protein